jgi:hypothetical protein
LRLRPIIMTSFAFILGVLPLVVSTGAGAEMRRTLGTAVFSGMLGVTFFGIFLTPVFFYVIAWTSDRPGFQSTFVQRISTIGLFIITLGIPFSVRWLLRRRKAISAQPAVPVPAVLETLPAPTPRASDSIHLKGK